MTGVLSPPWGGARTPSIYIASIKRINRKKGAKSISTYDFSTLYTKLPHDKLVTELIKLIDFCFNGGNKNFIKVNNWGKATWRKKTKNSIFFQYATMNFVYRFPTSTCCLNFVITPPTIIHHHHQHKNHHHISMGFQPSLCLL